MTIEQFAKAFAAIETIASNNAQLLRFSYGTSADDVCAVVRMARMLRTRHPDEAEQTERL